jgi:Fe-S oxidoreductase
MPRYAAEPFHRWFRRRPEPKTVESRVLLWPDTFSTYFRPQTAIAATRVLEALGYRVDIPVRQLCCGRPLYDWGMLGRARTLWDRTLQTLEAEIEAGTPIIGLEPACTSAFRDELMYLFSGDERAKQLSRRVHFFSDFLEHEVDAKLLPHTAGSAMVQFHCHHHAVLDTQSEVRLLQRLGLQLEVLKSGCCGMAGSFGFERNKYEISQAAAERSLLPKVRQSPEATIILANGFSCREQIEQGSGRRTMHVAELLANALPEA